MVGATTLDEHTASTSRTGTRATLQQVLVGEPSVERPSASCVGSKEYEAHHKVAIADAALVAAATLSDRYITAPASCRDKTIDLVDEAASWLRMEIDSSPEEIDKPQQVDRMKMEGGPGQETDPASVERLEKLRATTSRRPRGGTAGRSRWDLEEASLDRIGDLKIPHR